MNFFFFFFFLAWGRLSPGGMETSHGLGMRCIVAALCRFKQESEEFLEYEGIRTLKELLKLGDTVSNWNKFIRCLI